MRSTSPSGVNLSGGTGPRLAQQIESFEAAYPGRFVVFANVDFSDIDNPEFGALAAARLEGRRPGRRPRPSRSSRAWGCGSPTRADRRVPVDDPRLDPVWAKAGELGIPVLIHSGDPAEFWQEVDARNERWLELRVRPGRRQAGPPSFEQVLGRATEHVPPASADDIHPPRISRGSATTSAASDEPSTRSPT